MLTNITDASEEFDLKLHSLLQNLERLGSVVFLDTQDGGSGLIAAGFERKLECYGDCCVITEYGQEPAVEHKNPWDVLKKFRPDNDWCFGYLGYDLKNFLEELRSDNPDAVCAPDLFMMVPRLVIKTDARTGTLTVIKGELAPFQDMRNVPESGERDGTFYRIEQEPPQGDFIRMIEQAQVDIFNGDYYEVNLSRQIRGAFDGNSLALYQKMKKYGPVPFGAYINTEDFAICCASPERFLKKDGLRIQSEPIKGTAGVSDDEKVNQKILRELQESEKNKAENLMIVDLVRNDFSRIARRGSVKVEELFRIYRFRTVFQMVSKVLGEVEPETCPVEIIKACFPMGSMTGAPKISAMQAIEQLENYKRGIYSGAIGYIQPNGDFDFNVVIRTAVCKGNIWYYSTGGAITSGSDPKDEWRETETKARAITDIIIKS